MQKIVILCIHLCLLRNLLKFSLSIIESVRHPRVKLSPCDFI
jgi:hypothetical protein